MPSSSPPPLQQWEGEGTLHSYCYDYMRKRGWTETASAFAADAGINELEWKGPPIEAPQGLLYEWWSVFWDVFIARSQSTGKRNAMADSYVETMRLRRDPVVIKFAGQTAAQNITLPRSLSHPLRSASANSGPRPGYVNPGQVHVLQQQQLQEQLQQGRAAQAMPGPRNSLPLQSTSQYPDASPSQSAPPGSYPSNPHLSGTYPSRPSSAQSSPRLSHAPNPYSNGRPPSGPHGVTSAPLQGIFAQCLAAVGLAGRDAESLNVEEQAIVTAQMRRVGALPAAGSPQQNQMQQSSQLQLQQQQQQQQHHFRVAQQSRMVPQQRPTQEQQQRMQYATQQQQQHAHHQAQQQQMMQQQQQRMLQSRQASGQSFPPQAASPSSPAYVSAPSPYAHPLPPSTQPSPATFPVPLPPPLRVASAAGKGRGAAANRMSPANPTTAQKRAAQTTDDAAPRSRKKPKAAVAKEPPLPDINTNGIDVTRYDNPDSQTSLPFRPSQSPSMGPLDVPGNSMINARMAQHAFDLVGATSVSRAESRLPNQTMDPMHSNMNGGGDMGLNASGEMAKLNGGNSRPGSAANFRPPFPNELQMSNTSSSPHQNGSPGLMHSSIPPSAISYLPNDPNTYSTGNHSLGGMEQALMHLPPSNDSQQGTGSGGLTGGYPSYSAGSGGGENDMFGEMGLEFFDSFIDFEADKDPIVPS